jgi:beta-lactam-binding protein with PASTA domain
MVIATRGGPELLEIPDVRGLESGPAAAQLRMRGFTTDVSFRPVTEGKSDIVIETIPAAGEEIEAGSDVHIIASALARTPEPQPIDERGEDEGEEGGGRGKRGKGKGD